MRIRGPNCWLVEKDGSLEVTVGCRDCGWEAAKENVKEGEVHAELSKAAALFRRHKCN